jgi:hypothetical protein
VLRCPRKIKAKIYKKTSNIDLLVIRVSPTGPKNSKPCCECIPNMKLVGFRNVYYSTDEDDIVCEKVNNIQNSHRSQMSRVRHKPI